MVDWLIGVFYFFRPVAYMTFGKTVAGITPLEIFAGLSILLMAIILLARINTKSARIVTGLDITIVLYVIWVLGAYFAYFEKAHIKDVLKFIVPFITFVIIRRGIRGERQFRKLLGIMLAGYAIPIVLSAVLLILHKGVYVQDYWTKLYRYTGVYPNPHDFGHSMTFFLMVTVIYITSGKPGIRDGWRVLSTAKKIVIGMVCLAAVFCLYKSYVRTAYIGFVVFLFVYLYLENKKAFIAALSVLTVVVILFASVWALIFHDVVEVAEGKRASDRIASGRPYIWKHNILLFEKLTFDRQLAGVGVGNRIHVLNTLPGEDDFWNSHNDFLEVMIQTGIVGFILFSIIQVFVLFGIRSLPPPLRRPYVALFLAVISMNLASNSYVSRAGLGQSLYMVLAFAEWYRINNKRGGRLAYSRVRPVREAA